MRFSIRSLLAVLLLFGLAFPLVQGMRAVELDLARQAQLRNEIEVLRTRLDSKNPTSMLIREHQAQQFESVASIRKTAESNFEKLQRKYAAIEAVDSENL